MSTNDDLRQVLNRIDGKGYPAYKDIRGEYEFPGFTLLIDHVQGDPFAAPSRLRVRVPQGVAGYPAA
jgi:predicted ABC-class ATPase